MRNLFEVEDALFVICNHEAKRFMLENPRLRVNKQDQEGEVHCTVRYDKRSTKAVINKARSFLSSRHKFQQEQIQRALKLLKKRLCLDLATEDKLPMAVIDTHRVLFRVVDRMQHLEAGCISFTEMINVNTCNT